MLRFRDDVTGDLEVLVERSIQHRLVGVLVHLIGRVGEAEDLTQDVFLRIYRAPQGLPARAKFSLPGCSRSPTTSPRTTSRSKGRSPISPGVGAPPRAVYDRRTALRPAEERSPASRADPLGPDALSPSSPTSSATPLEVLGEDQKISPSS